MIKENKTKKYLLYAFGEIILVVIGILIALQVNEWNNDRNKRKAEQIVLAQIQSDLEKSKLELADIKAYHLRRIKDCNKILRAFWNKELLNDSIAYDLRLGRSTINYSPILGNLKSLIDSGNIDLVGASELKNEIVSYLEKVESQLKDLTRIEESYFRKGVEIIDDIMPNGALDKGYYVKELEEEVDLEKVAGWYVTGIFPTPLRAENVVTVPFKADISELFQNKQFFNGYKKVWTHQFNSYRIYDEILVITNQLLDKLKKLEKN
jgi:hypothetical protein